MVSDNTAVISVKNDSGERHVTNSFLRVVSNISLMKYTFLCSQAALFFGVDKLLDKCGIWLAEVTSFSGFQSPQLFLDDLIHIWKYGFEHGEVFHMVHSVHDKYAYRRSQA